MFKHWAVIHSDLADPPKFEFRVVKVHKDPLTRMIQEAVKIVKHASMNSKTEHRGYKIPRIIVEKDPRETKKDFEEGEGIV